MENLTQLFGSDQLKGKRSMPMVPDRGVHGYPRGTRRIPPELASIVPDAAMR